jgi:hypothetical protein
MGAVMPKYYVEMKIDFSGEIEAESKEDAERLAAQSWGDTMDADVGFDGIYSIDVEELEDEDEDEEEDM